MRPRLASLAAAAALLFGVAPAAHGAAARAVWPTYHRSTAHDGVDSTSPPARRIRPAWKSTHLDGLVFAEPLLVRSRLYVATQNNSVYALRAATGDVIWRAHLATPVRRADLPCGSIDPLVGIISTPVIDVSRRTLYAVTFERGFHHRLVALDLAAGAVRWRRDVDPPEDPMVEQQRPALLLAHGRVYIGYGGLLGDCTPFHGWLVGAPADNRGANVLWRSAGGAGGVWGASGPVPGDRGDILTSVGEGRGEDVYDGGNAVVSLTPDLGQRDFFAARNWAELNRTDLDLGSVGPSPVGRNMVFQIGKEGTGYLASTTRLGGIGGEVYGRRACHSAYGGTAFEFPYLYLPCRDGLTAVRLNSTRTRFVHAWRGPQTFAAPPILAGGLVWSLGQGKRLLYALEPRTGRVRYQAHITGRSMSFVTPTAGDGRLFMAAGDRIAAFTWR